MMKNKLAYSLGLLGFFTALSFSGSAWCLEEIPHPYQGIRSLGMGGLSLSTGLYDENFFGNPARVLANPSWRVSIFDLMTEMNAGAPSHLSDLSSSNGDFYSKMSSTAGSNTHFRMQTAFPAYYLPPGPERRNGYAIGLLVNAQTNVNLRNSYQIDPDFMADVGPALTVGRKFFDNDLLGLGLTTHLTYRVASSKTFTFLDLIKGTALSGSNIAGQGAHLDFDLGGTYRLPLEYHGVIYSVAASVNNLLGGKYDNLGFKPMSEVTLLPPPQPRNFGFGASAAMESLGILENTVFALEFHDFGNNQNGGFFRTVHLGAEARYKILTPRIGFNQGYFTAGVGVNLKLLNIDFATYGEEMSLNSGGLEDRRYALKLSLQI